MYKYLLFFCLICSVAFVSCKKDDNTISWVSTSQDYANAQAYIQEIFKIVDEAAKNNAEIYKLASLDCATVTLEADTPGVFPKTLIIDYGLVNCIGTDGRKRRGVIRAVFNERYSEPGTSVQISFDNFFINNYKVTSNNLKITNTSNLIQTQYHFHFPNLRFTNSSGQGINANGSHTFVLVEGDSTQIHSDDKFQVSGSFSGNGTAGSAFVATITEPLILNYECRSFTFGILNISLSDVDGVFNYGDGTCNDEATVLIDGRQFYINLE
ncbi:MAG: hypothetical protein ACR2GN_08325 [Bacteroidia bacterium]